MTIVERFKALPRSSRQLLSFAIVFFLVVALPFVIWAITNLNFNPQKGAQEAVRESVNIDGEPFKGPETALVTIVEFGDFQCPFCKSFAETTLPQILAQYPTQVKFVFKDFPLTGIHPLAEHAAIAAECAFAQNKFWEMHDLIYTNQDTLAEENFATFSAQLGLDQPTFDTCYTNQTPLGEINGDLAEGQALQITGAPTFFINGIRVIGSQPFDAFKTIIDSELTDDIFFKDSGNSVTFTTTDQNPNVSVDPANLENGKTYTLNVTYALQNNLKYQYASTSAIPIIVLVNNVFKSAKDIPYSLIAIHQDGASDSQGASFEAQGGVTNIEVVADPNNVFPETNEENNSLSFNFTAQASSTSNATATATPAETVSPTATPAPEGTPNSCGGTCGSNYNCKAELYCHLGYCRDPLCPNDSTCGCQTPKPSPTLKPKTTIKPTPTSQIVIYIEPSFSPKVSPTGSPLVGLSTPQGNPKQPITMNFKTVGIGALILALLGILLMAIAKSMKGKGGPPKITPPAGEPSQPVETYPIDMPPTQTPPPTF